MLRRRSAYHLSVLCLGRESGGGGEGGKRYNLYLKWGAVPSVQSPPILDQAHFHFNPLRTNSDLSQTSHCNNKSLSAREVMRIENMITQVKFY